MNVKFYPGVYQKEPPPHDGRDVIFVDFNAYRAQLGGADCWISNAPYFAASEVAGELSDHTGFGACYFEAEGGRYQYSLRSRGDFDVSAIARLFGGGGHKAASGFTVDKPVHKRLDVDR